jgi:hypothetical protein
MIALVGDGLLTQGCSILARVLAAARTFALRALDAVRHFLRRDHDVMRRSHEICDECGRKRPLPVKIAATPLRKEVRDGCRGGVLTLSRRQLPVAGSGQQLVRCLRADWVKEFAAILHAGSYYGWAVGYGPVKIDVPSGKRLEEILGDEYARARVGLVVRLDACLMFDRNERQVGVGAGTDHGRPLVFWAECSRREALELRERLFGGHRCPPSDTAAGSDFIDPTTENREMA